MQGKGREQKKKKKMLGGAEKVCVTVGCELQGLRIHSATAGSQSHPVATTMILCSTQDPAFCVCLLGQDVVSLSGKGDVRL